MHAKKAPWIKGVAHWRDGMAPGSYITDTLPPRQGLADKIERLQAALQEIAAKDRTGYRRAALGRIARRALTAGEQR